MPASNTWPTHLPAFRVGEGQFDVGSRRHAIAPDHENPESERVIAESRRFAVIETVTPEATELARRSDPRRGS